MYPIRGHLRPHSIQHFHRGTHVDLIGEPHHGNRERLVVEGNPFAKGLHTGRSGGPVPSTLEAQPEGVQRRCDQEGHGSPDADAHTPLSMCERGGRPHASSHAAQM